MFEHMATEFADPLAHPEPGREPDDAWTAPQLWVTDEAAELDITATLGRLLEAQPGPDVLSVATALSELTLTDAQRVDLVAVLERCDAWLQAVKQPMLAGLSRSAGSKARTPGRYEDVGLELGLALRWSEWMCHDRMTTARLLDERLPGTWAALAAGEISYLQARLIAAGAAILDHPDADDPIAAAAELERRVLPKAPRQSRVETEKAITLALIAIDPGAARQRRKKARQGRGVYRTGRPRGLDGRLEGRAGLYVEGTPEDIATIWQSLSAGADELLAAGRVDNLSQGRHDTMLSWACEHADQPTAVRTAGRARPAHITVISKDTTLRGEDDDAADLVGWGPIPADAARDLANGVAPRPGPFSDPTSPVDADTAITFGRTQHDEIDDPDIIDTVIDSDPRDDDPPTDPHDDGGGGGGGGGPPDRPSSPLPAPTGASTRSPVQLRILRIDPDSGFALPEPGLRLDYGTSRRTFPVDVVAHLIDKYRVCGFPGCTSPVHLLEGDHWRPAAAGGPTDASTNGGPGCTHHNRTTRNRPGWHITPHGDGTATLITPHGRRYPVEPFDYRDL